MNKNDHNNKMLNILNDQNTFKVVDVDETMKQEDKLIRKLKQLKNDGFINEKEYNYCRPTGSQPARMYGLPKIHKIGVPLRPIVSASGTFNYKLAKLLANKLEHLRKSDTIITNTFFFVDELLSLSFDNSEIKMISFDIISLFTNVPLTRTIQIILERLYGPEHTFTYSDKRREDWCNKCKNRFEMKYLLETCTSDTNFNFNNKIYSQINGVAMDSPLGPLFADIYVNYLESKLMSRLKRNGILFWKRFVDDTFVIIKKDADINKLIDILNSFDNNIIFTYEEEVDNSLPFLDIYITRLPPNDTVNNSTNNNYKIISNNYNHISNNVNTSIFSNDQKHKIKDVTEYHNSTNDLNIPYKKRFTVMYNNNRNNVTDNQLNKERNNKIDNNICKTKNNKSGDKSQLVYNNKLTNKLNDNLKIRSFIEFLNYSKKYN